MHLLLRLPIVRSIEFKIGRDQHRKQVHLARLTNTRDDQPIEKVLLNRAYASRTFRYFE